MRRQQELLLVAGVFIWCATVVYLYRGQDSLSVTKESQHELDRVSIMMQQLQKQNAQLQQVVDQISVLNLSNNSSSKDARDTVEKLRALLKRCQSQQSKKIGSNGDQHAPSKEHEVLLKRIENGVVELWYAMETELRALEKHSSQVDTSAGAARLSMQQRSILIDIEDLNNLALTWKEEELKDLQDIVRRRIDYIQNPKDCSTARQLICKLNKGCGFGCQVHHLVYCALVAFGTERTLVIESRNWRYNPSGWEAVFQPVSKTCLTASGSAVQWSGENASKNDQIVVLPIVDGLSHRPPYLPLGIPEDLAPRLMRLHGNPSVWWIGQFMKYVMRPQEWLQQDLDDFEKKLGFKKPIVGIQVRRTDKVGTEAAFHSIDEYMKHVQAWYEKYELRLSKTKSGAGVVRRVYVATDDPSVLPEAKQKYPDYEFISDNAISQSASLNSRYTKESLRGVVADIHFLSKCDFLVCTFSSQVCRVAYELMQTLHPDASSYFHSLDDVYYYGGQTGHDQVAIFDHVAGRPEEIDLKVGDVVGIAGNHWDGYSKGTNRRTGKVGLYPSYKVIESYRLVKYPTYPEANPKR